MDTNENNNLNINVNNNVPPKKKSGGIMKFIPYVFILGIILVLFLYLFKIFTLSFEITSMISILKGKNIIKISLYLFYLA